MLHRLIRRLSVLGTYRCAYPCTIGPVLVVFFFSARWNFEVCHLSKCPFHPFVRIRGNYLANYPLKPNGRVLRLRAHFYVQYLLQLWQMTYRRYYYYMSSVLSVLAKLLHAFRRRGTGARGRAPSKERPTTWRKTPTVVKTSSSFRRRFPRSSKMVEASQLFHPGRQNGEQKRAVDDTR